MAKSIFCLQNWQQANALARLSLPSLVICIAYAARVCECFLHLAIRIESENQMEFGPVWMCRARHTIVLRLMPAVCRAKPLLFFRNPYAVCLCVSKSAHNAPDTRRYITHTIWTCKHERVKTLERARTELSIDTVSPSASFGSLNVPGYALRARSIRNIMKSSGFFI